MAKSIKALQRAIDNADSVHDKWVTRFFNAMADYVYFPNSDPSREDIVGRCYPLKELYLDASDSGYYLSFGRARAEKQPSNFADYLILTGVKVWAKTCSWQGNWYKNVTAKVTKQLRRLEARCDYWADRREDLELELGEREDAE